MRSRRTSGRWFRMASRWFWKSLLTRAASRNLIPQTADIAQVPACAECRTAEPAGSAVNAADESLPRHGHSPIRNTPASRMSNAIFSPHPIFVSLVGFRRLVQKRAQAPHRVRFVRHYGWRDLSKTSEVYPVRLTHQSAFDGEQAHPLARDSTLAPVGLAGSNTKNFGDWNSALVITLSI